MSGPTIRNDKQAAKATQDLREYAPVRIKSVFSGIDSNALNVEISQYVDAPLAVAQSHLQLAKDMTQALAVRIASLGRAADALIYAAMLVGKCTVSGLPPQPFQGAPGPGSVAASPPPAPAPGVKPKAARPARKPEAASTAAPPRRGKAGKKSGGKRR